ncbi:MAG: sulfate ABC transporter permease subunit CysT, partial [Gemmatimonadales bacterium]
MRKRSGGVLPGFGLSLGITCTYLSLVVLLPLATVFARAADLSGAALWATVTDPRVMASYRVTFGASFVAALI